MISVKNQYYLFIENTRDFDLNLIKIKNKFSIIYRSNKKAEDVYLMKKFRNQCRIKGIKLYIANNISLLNNIRADGFYVSASNKVTNLNRINRNIYHIIGSAHNYKELSIKIKLNCRFLIFSRLFKTEYKKKKGFLGVCKFNLIGSTIKKNLIPLGGIRLTNLNYLKIINTNAFSLLSEVKKKPAIISRLF